MSTFPLDNKGDWTFDGPLLTGTPEVAQNCATRLREWTNDWFEDMARGINYLGLLGTPNTKKQLLEDVQRVLISTEGVAQVDATDAKISLKNRTAVLTYSVITIYDDRFSNTLEMSNNGEPGLYTRRH